MAIFNQSKNTAFNPQEINIINAGTKISGDLSSEGDLRIDGSVTGNINVKTKLVLGASANVQGNITAQNCDVSGVLNGDINVSELLTVKATAKITGDITSSKLIIEAGAEFNGKSSMNSDTAINLNDYKNIHKNGKPSDTKAPVISGSIAEKASL
ncbi:MAG: polymer-forming cytoskeletal protein [Bacteroidia bacterium]|nr:polymer-forming cytoskeletal protein [Bacteroidia bacterium]